MNAAPSWAVDGEVPAGASFEDHLSAASHCCSAGQTDRARQLAQAALRIDGPSSSQPLLVLSSVPWSFLHQRPQQLALELGRQGCLTLYVDPAASAVVVPVHDPTRLRSLLLDAILMSIRRQGPNCYTVPYVRFVEDASGNRHEDAPHLFFDILKDLLVTRTPWVLAYLPTHVETLGFVGETGLIAYDCVDEFSGFTHSGANVEAVERQLLQKSDVVFVTAGTLQRSKSASNPRVYLVPNGVDPVRFAGCQETPPELAGSTDPVITFVGALADWVDLELIRSLALRRPQWRFLLIGPSFTPTGSIQGLTNVLWVGRKEYEELPAYLQHSSVGIVPFKINDLTLNSDPIKCYEYLAAGLPVVSTDLPQVRRFQTPGVVEIASSPEDFDAAITRLLSVPEGEAEQLCAARLQVARRESWASRAATMLAIMAGHYAMLKGQWQAAASAFSDPPEGLPGLARLSLDRAIAEALCQGRDDEVSEHIHEIGASWVANGRLAPAQKLFQDRTELAPQDADGWFNLASVYARFERWDDALEALTRYCDLTPPDGDTLALIGTVLVGGGHTQLAKEVMEHTLHLYPERGDVRETLATLQALAFPNNRQRDAAGTQEAEALVQRILQPQLERRTTSSSESGVWDAVFNGVSAKDVQVPSKLALELEDLFGRFLPPGSAALEAGSGSGALSAHLAQLGYVTTLLDRSEVALQLSQQVYARYGVNAQFVRGDLFRMPFGDRSFDCVWNSGVMEHFDDDTIVSGLQEMARVSRNLVIVLVPNAGALLYRASKWKLEQSGHWPYGEEFPRHSSVDLFRRAGLTVLAEEYLGLDAGVDWARYLGTVGEDVLNTLRAWIATLGPQDEALRASLGYLVVTIGAVARQPSSSMS